MHPGAAAGSSGAGSELAALGELTMAGLDQGTEEGNGRARYWSPATPDTDDNAGGGEATADSPR